MQDGMPAEQDSIRATHPEKNVHVYPNYPFTAVPRFIQEIHS